MSLTELSSAAEVLVAADHDPYVRGRLMRTDVSGWAGHGAVAWRFTHAGDAKPYVMTHGAPSAVALLVEELLTELRDGQQMNVPRGTPAALPAWVALSGTDWDFRWTDTPPPLQPGERAVVEVDEEEVQALLAQAHPEAAAQPGDPRVRRWLGLRDPSGLLACGADTSEATGVGHISSIATHPCARGQGLGATVTAALIRTLLAEGCDVVTLGMYASNTAGRALYDRSTCRTGASPAGTCRSAPAGSPPIMDVVLVHHAQRDGKNSMIGEKWAVSPRGWRRRRPRRAAGR